MAKRTVKGRRKKAVRAARKKSIAIIAIAVIIVVAVLILYAVKPDLFAGLLPQTPPPAPSSAVIFLPKGVTVSDSKGVDLDKNGLLTVHFIDVGQGDAIFFSLPDGKTLLLDAGSGANASAPTEQKDKFTSYLEAMSVDEIDYLVVTHPHTDHMNMMSEVLDSYQVNNVCYNNISDDDCSATYRKFKQKAQAEPNVNLHLIDSDGEADGKVYTIQGANYDYSFDFYASGYEELGGDMNAISIITVLDYENVQAVFTGDAEKETEEWFMSVMQNLTFDVDVLKVGHHGSSTSSGQEFLDYVMPEYAVISVGEGNSYKHPHEETIDKLYDEGIVTYRTDKNGTVILCIDYQGDFAFITEESSEVENNSKNVDPKTMVK